MHSQETDDAILRDELEVVQSACDLEDTQAITINDTGWDSRVYIVGGGETVFKFARSDQVQYRGEIAALQLLNDLDLPVLVPQLLYVARDGHYFSYSGIVGEDLVSITDQLSENKRAEVGSTTGQFLQVLHHQTLSDAPRWELDDEIGVYLDKYRLAAAVLDDAFSIRDRQVVHEFFTTQLPTELRRLGSALVLAHGDLGPWNIMLTPAGEMGVIDFGDIGYHDASKDFSGLGDHIITTSALDTYRADQVLRDKAALRARALPVLDIPFFMGKDDQAGIGRCLDGIRAGILGDATTTKRLPRQSW